MSVGPLGVMSLHGQNAELSRKYEKSTETIFFARPACLTNDVSNALEDIEIPVERGSNHERTFALG